jgi:hypothetical protein
MSQSNLEKGQRLFDDGKTDQAEVIFKSILKSDPSNLKAIEYLGILQVLTSHGTKPCLIMKN